MSKIYIVGIGPGRREQMTLEVISALEESEIIIGYTRYIELIKPYYPNKQLIASPMQDEINRCRLAVRLAKEENTTLCVISSGDSGVYGMAGLLLELSQKEGYDGEIEILPGVTAATACAALLGAPINHDFAVISLSDLLTPSALIQKRVRLAAKADFVLCLYNPKSTKRKALFDTAVDIILKYRPSDTPAGVVKNAGRALESVVITTLGELKTEPVDMTSTVLIGNSQTYIKDGKIITPRGYTIH